MSPHGGPDASTPTDPSSHSIVHGFSIGRISSSTGPKTKLPTPTPILKPTAPPKAAVFTLGGSSDEDKNGSFKTQMYPGEHGFLPKGLKKPALNRMTTSFKDEATTRTIQDNRSSESDKAIETDSESEEDDEDQWEDDDAGGPSSFDDRELFQRVDSRLNLTSHRSLLTTLMHEGDRAQALQNAASRSTPAMRRSRTSSPNGPSLATSPQEDSGLMMSSTQIPRSKPILMTTSNTHPPALSPRTTRRNMLQTELTESLRKHLLWERQQKNAVPKQHQSAIAANPALQCAMTTNDIKSMNVFKYFDQGPQEYHQKGW